MRHPALILASALALGSGAGADPFLALPIECRLGENCHIQQFVDRDPGPGATDFRCGPLSYDGHRGTDFALRTLADLSPGVAVLAAAPGRVIGVRDGMADILQTTPDAPDVAGRECGNGVAIDHGDGWQTQYCHLARGSVTVAEGEVVPTGHRIGEVGLSGMTQFPHLHLTVRRNGDIVDPFAPSATETCDPDPSDSLWLSPPAYQPGALIDAAFATSVPEYAAIKAGLPEPDLDRAAPLVLWGYLFGGQAGDILRIVAQGPDGPTFAQDVTLDRTQAQLFRAFGRRAPAEGWPAGAYRGTLSVIRNGVVIDETTVIGEID
ncbi:M23 family metallopeptidase [Ponticoccus sp. SC2-23]|uniref:M23 family metallopeptidase n=1 Tax=Alexandriicola marinus TaxID=2081710 RepID=UPI000FDA896F|nr:M23 family metallopeptidase [Alexandriicola marinus]MBM1220089.1 M23 family metallopeptidase [Ponticoccus sp. SC6-9]MBM1224775.1 M23 family metallopeptidase [Ponticoccus sp. SC6-15]MBM1228288.1 M23 family metallopeptidase [Ponticoccus sp. SC6-38]MBM1234074.1 M23 family metallopeptidase [Ponticoccus sp. SC6-45]MBM1238790.1 M23 family metallopeptidase [Ponticoccus sp. SC6-49]MBM1242571.1 M23 family metallopeptidase [Ponticoccus sp. SC2-64]MBM1247598.1 M23 family metallopeptidase [Ponticoccu